MERAGFIGIRRRLHLLVKQNPQSKASAGLFLPSKDSVPTSTRLTTESERKLPPGKPEIEITRLEGYLKSYGEEYAQYLGEEAQPHEIEEKLQAADVSYKDGFGWSLLHFAVQRSPLSVVKHLLELRADPNAMNCLHRTPLHLAVMQDDAEIVTELLNYGANPNLGDADGWTPVHFAVHLGHIRSLQVVLAFEPDFQACNDAKKTPKDYIKCPKVHSAILGYERQREDSRSQDGIETADVSLADSPHGNSAFFHSKGEGHEKLLRGSLTTETTIVRAQRPNEESGAIVSPHPNSAYS